MGLLQSTPQNKCPGAVIVAAPYQGKTHFADKSREWTDIDKLMETGPTNAADIAALQQLGNFMVTSNTSLQTFAPSVAVVCVPEAQLAQQAPKKDFASCKKDSEALRRAAAKKKIIIFDNFDEAALSLVPAH